MILNNFRLDDQGRIIPVGNLKGKISTGGLVPGVPIWTGEASGNPVYFEDGSNNIIDYTIENAIENETIIYVRGINIFDEEIEIGRINTSTGEPAAAPGQRTKNYQRVKPNTTYYIKTSTNIHIIEYDENKQYLRYASSYANRTYTTSPDTYYIKFYSTNPDTGLDNTGVNYPATKTDYIQYNQNSTEYIYPQDIISLTGDNVMWNDFGNMDVIYIRDWNIALNMLWNVVFP